MCTCCITWWPCWPALDPASERASGRLRNGSSVCSRWGRAVVQTELHQSAAPCLVPVLLLLLLLPLLRQGCASLWCSPSSPLCLPGWSDTLTLGAGRPSCCCPAAAVVDISENDDVGFYSIFSPASCFNAHHTAVVSLDNVTTVLLCPCDQCWFTRSSIKKTGKL